MLLEDFIQKGGKSKFYLEHKTCLDGIAVGHGAGLQYAGGCSGAGRGVGEGLRWIEFLRLQLAAEKRCFCHASASSETKWVAIVTPDLIR